MKDDIVRVVNVGAHLNLRYEVIHNTLQLLACHLCGVGQLDLLDGHIMPAPRGPVNNTKTSLPQRRRAVPVAWAQLWHGRHKTKICDTLVARGNGARPRN
jgi:hypothetical protein